MAPDEVRRWSEVGPQWVELCSKFLEANKEFRAATAAAKAGIPGAREAAVRWAMRVRETEADCVYFMRHRVPRPNGRAEPPPRVADLARTEPT